MAARLRVTTVRPEDLRLVRLTAPARRAFLQGGSWSTDLIERGTIYGTLSGAKLSCIAYLSLLETPSA